MKKNNYPSQNQQRIFLHFIDSHTTQVTGSSKLECWQLKKKNLQWFNFKLDFRIDLKMRFFVPKSMLAKADIYSYTGKPASYSETKTVNREL